MFLYESLQRLIFFIAWHLFRPLIGSEKARQFLVNKHPRELEKKINTLPTGRNCIWVHVASAGELEQVKPIVSHIFAMTGLKTLLTYTSPSTVDFIKPSPWLLEVLPLPLDCTAHHNMILKTCSVKCLFFVRYDIWPSLLNAVHKKGIPVALLAATSRNTKGGAQGKLSYLYKKLVFRKFTAFFVVQEEDKGYFRKMNPAADVFLSGDAKWHRSRERAHKAPDKIFNHKLLLELKAWVAMQTKQGFKIVVVGSPHEEERKIVKALIESDLPLSFVIVPHDLTPDALLHEKSFLPDHTMLTQGCNHESRVVIVNAMGILAECYYFAWVAIVGGGFDGAVHNTLEPAAHGVPVILGSRLNRAPEAQSLIKAKAGLAFHHEHDMLKFFDHLVNNTELQQRLSVNAGKVFSSLPNTPDIISRWLQGILRK